MKHHLVHRARSAFSLAELLVSIVIILIVSALVFPVYQNIQRNAKAVQCLSNLRNYGSGVLAYAADNSGFPWRDGNATRNLTPGATKPNFEAWVRPYLHKAEDARLRCPLKGIDDNNFNYSGNGALCIYYPQLKGIPVPASRVALAAETYAPDTFYHSVHLNMTMWGISEADAQGGVDGFGEGQARKPHYHGTAHARGLNIFFLDGHVQLITPAKNDWREAPTFGNPTNGGYFYEKSQFSHMKQYPELY